MTDEPITSVPIPGHDQPASVNGAGPHDTFDPDAADTPERHAVEMQQRVGALEQHVGSLRTVAVVLTLALIGVGMIATVVMLRTAKDRA